jgi:putative PIG3 family NAD(P)H quinone oxidoreductase
MSALPQSMRYVDHGAGGPPEVLRLAEGPLPVLRPGEILVAVEYAGVNRPDVLQRQGAYPPPPGASPVLGLEVAGRVVAAAPDVAEPPVGALVCALAPGGGYAEYCAVPAAHALPVPAGVSVAEAAALPETVFTVWDNVFTRGRLAPGEALLVHGGAGGIGTTAIQLARALGARVFATVGSDDKARACERAGADAGINYRTHDFEAEVARLTDGRGVDVVLDIVAGPYVEKNLRALAPDGRLVQIATLQGGRATLDLRELMARRLTVTGSTLRPRTVAQKAAVARAVGEHVWPLVERGLVRPAIHAVVPLAHAAEAHRMMEASEHTGKIVLAVAGDDAR